MSLVFGCIAPHPPVLLPEIGRGRERDVFATSRALSDAALRFGRTGSRTVFIVTPHGPAYHEAMGVYSAPASSGNMDMWGVGGISFQFENDAEAVELLKGETEAAAIPMGPWPAGYDLDHGVLVPIYFLQVGMPGAALVPLTFSWLPLNRHFDFGKALGRVCARLQRPCAIIASGDMSHRLLPGAPNGYHPSGKIFDRALAEAVGKLDAQALLAMDPRLIEEAGECGLRSVMILLGALEGLQVRPEVLSYEGPFGVGYLVATFEVEAPGKSA
jgi:aromatic ring-opening dioxygenase LigB subunit